MVTWTLKLSKDLRSWHCSFPNCHGTVSDVSKDSSCDFPRCNIDPSKLAVPEVFAPVSIKRFIGGLGAWISGSACFRCFSLLSIVEISGASLSIRSNEVLFPPQTKFRVKEDRQGLSMGFHFSINIASDLCDIYSTYVMELFKQSEAKWSKCHDSLSHVKGRQ